MIILDMQILSSPLAISLPEERKTREEIAGIEPVTFCSTSSGIAPHSSLRKIFYCLSQDAWALLSFGSSDNNDLIKWDTADEKKICWHQEIKEEKEKSSSQFFSSKANKR